MAYRLLNSNTDPQRMIRLLRLRRDLQQGLEMALDRIWTAGNSIELTHAHGRALGLGTGLRLVGAITPQQFKLLAEAYARAFEHCLAVLTDQTSHEADE